MHQKVDILKKKRIIISGINMVEGGIFTILHNVLKEFSTYCNPTEIELIALVPSKNGLEFPNIQYLEFPDSKKSWFKRLYYEYFYFKKLSQELQPDIWLSLHDTTPNVVTKKQFVYCHHPTTFFKPTWKDWQFDIKIGIFHLLYDYLFQYNIKKNHCVFVQQHWIKDEFKKRFGLFNIKVTPPPFVEQLTEEKFTFESGKIHFLFPSFPRSFKNHEVILNAIPLLPDFIKEKVQFHFTTIKDNPSKYAQYLQTTYGHLTSVVFHPKVNRKQLLAMYNSMDALIFPSKIETWGLPISEAKAYHKPLLLANLPYAKEACGTYELVSFFDATNPEELAHLITQFVDQTIVYTGNSVTFDSATELKNWPAIFDYMLKA